MVHKCKTCESDKMQDLVYGQGIFYCRACLHPVEYKDVHPKILEEWSGR
jgi:ribosomal protein L37AE/L43A